MYLLTGPQNGGKRSDGHDEAAAASREERLLKSGDPLKDVQGVLTYMVSSWGTWGQPLARE
jgi:hypothetical protein